MEHIIRIQTTPINNEIERNKQDLAQPRDDVGCDFLWEQDKRSKT